MHNSSNARKMTRTLRAVSVPDDFDVETKLIVLNFMGLIPASCPATAAVCESSNSDEGPPLDSSQESDQLATSLPFLRHGLETVEEASSSTASPSVEAWQYDGNLAAGIYSTPTPGVELSPTADFGPDISHIVPKVHLSNSSQCIQLTSPSTTRSLADLASHQLQPVTPPVQTASPQPWALQAPMFCSRTPSPRGSMVAPMAERQSSARSSASGHSIRSSTHGAYIDVLVADVESLVRTRALSPLVLPLREEIYRELDEMEPGSSGIAMAASAEALVSGTRPAMTPESEVAEMLRSLGDRVQDEFGEELERAVAELVPLVPTAVGISYEALQATALRLLSVASPGWTQVALVLLLGQRVSWQMLMQGDRSVGQMAEYTTQFIGDHVANFIISNGGWQSILDLGLDELVPDDPDYKLNLADPAGQVNGLNTEPAGSASTTEPVRCLVDSSDSESLHHEQDNPDGKTDAQNISDPRVNDSGIGGETSCDESTSFANDSEKVPLIGDASRSSEKPAVGDEVPVASSEVANRKYLFCVTLCAFVVLGVCIYYQRVVRM